MTDGSVSRARFEALASELEAALAGGGAVEWSEEAFERAALRAWRFQYEHNEVYRSFCDGRGVPPEAVTAWGETPAVPSRAFKHLELSTVPGSPEAVFLTSGTSRGRERRGRHPVPRASLYRAALLPPIRRYLFEGGRADRLVSLIPSAKEAPESSLSFMVSTAAAALADRVHWVVGADGALDQRGFVDAVERAGREGGRLVIVGTALAFVHLLESLGPRRLSAPPGTTLMETGGFKGDRRETTRERLYSGLAETVGIDPARIVSEYGMTELLSQLYEPVLAEGPGARGVYVPAPSLRVRAVDPVSLEPLPEGERGILCFFDLANLGSVCHVLTEDFGSVRDGRVELVGRLGGAEPRGCSRAMDELLGSVERS